MLLLYAPLPSRAHPCFVFLDAVRAANVVQTTTVEM